MPDGTMQAERNASAFDGGNTSYLESLYDRYLEDPNGVPAQWREYFAQLPSQNGGGAEESHEAIKAQFIELAKSGALQTRVVVATGSGREHELKQIEVSHLINAYRLHGHLCATIDPLEMRKVSENDIRELSLEDCGLAGVNPSTVFDAETFVGPKQMTLGALFQALRESYCGTIGVEYMHLVSREEREWVQARMEGSRGRIALASEKRREMLARLTAAEGLEKYLGMKYPGAKRFSLEGGESLIPLLDEIIDRGGEQGLRECVIGMAHRGRLNVLVNVLGKAPQELFDEFEGKRAPSLVSGDVKYHQGFSSNIATSGGNVHLVLAFNPSHLEIVTPVVLGSVRARQNRSRDEGFNKVLPVAIHGDAAFAGQGVVMETLNMSQTRGYGVGGTIHIVVNNQIGFTTSHPQDARSTLYCTDVAKVVLAPIFHVNADDPEAVVFVAQMATDYRMRFNKDVVIDLVCYRRHGHNEADDPMATQPMMYSKIKSHPTVRQWYAERLMKAGVVTSDEADAMLKTNRECLDKGSCVARRIVNGVPSFLDWKPYFSDNWREKVATGLSADAIATLAEKLFTIPAGAVCHPRVLKVYEDRLKMAKGELPIDWGFGEIMAYAGILADEMEVRLSGQDCGRGTFFHRHAVLHDQKTGDSTILLDSISQKSRFKVIDSLLSEEAVLAFEYGYATADPSSLVMWEAQFGDFANGAQVVIDQFISSGEQKWGRLCGMVMLLPHGYEGQGPEHSSARLERYLQLCAQHNIQVCVPSNAAQVFHMLRRQMKRHMRKPLIVMTPKSLLRHKGAASAVHDLVTGSFQAVIGETAAIEASRVAKVVLCSGKVYYDLIEKRDQLQKNHIAVIRIEQLYPFPELELEAELKRYPNAKKVVWCQEEPKNQGAWFCSQHHFRACLLPGQTLRFAGRKASASPAAGYSYMHEEQQAALVEDALK